MSRAPQLRSINDPRFCRRCSECGSNELRLVRGYYICRTCATVERVRPYHECPKPGCGGELKTRRGKISSGGVFASCRTCIKCGSGVTVAGVVVSTYIAGTRQERRAGLGEVRTLSGLVGRHDQEGDPDGELARRFWLGLE